MLGRINSDHHFAKLSPAQSNFNTVGWAESPFIPTFTPKLILISWTPSISYPEIPWLASATFAK